VTGPTVTGLIPSSGAAGTAVTVSGTGFSTVAGATTVSFGTVAGTQVACSSTTTCTAVAPAGSGTVDVTVNVNGQTSAISSSDRFSYVDFTVSASPNSVTVVRGGAPGSYSVTATPTGAYAGTVVWSNVTGGPVGTTFTFSPPNVTLPKTPTTTTTSTLTVSATHSTPTGTFTLTITGFDGSASRSTTVTLTINRK